MDADWRQLVNEAMSWTQRGLHKQSLMVFDQLYRVASHRWRMTFTSRGSAWLGGATIYNDGVRQVLPVGNEQARLSRDKFRACCWAV